MFVEQVYELIWNVIAAGLTGVAPASITKNGIAVTEISVTHAEEPIEVQGDTTDAANISDDVVINVRFGDDNVDTPLVYLGAAQKLTKFTRKSSLISLTADNNHASVNAKPKAKVIVRIPQ